MSQSSGLTAARPQQPVVSSFRRPSPGAGAVVGKRPPQIAGQLVSLVGPNSFEADQYRTLRHIVERLHKDNGFQVIAVTSPGAAEGKTLTAINLAGTLAQSPEARILLVDADLRRPSVDDYLALGGQRSPGLVEAILDPQCSLRQTVRRLDPFNLSVLPTGSTQIGTYELLTSPRFEELLGEARRLYDYVLIDTPPLVPFPDCRLIGRWVDGLLIIVAAHRTPRKMLAEALNLLEPAKVIGVVFNGDDRPLSAYYGHDYYYYAPRPRPGGRHPGWWRRTLTAARGLSRRRSSSR